MTILAAKQDPIITILPLELHSNYEGENLEQKNCNIEQTKQDDGGAGAVVSVSIPQSKVMGSNHVPNTGIRKG